MPASFDSSFELLLYMVGTIILWPVIIRDVSSRRQLSPWPAIAILVACAPALCMLGILVDDYAPSTPVFPLPTFG